MNPRFLQARFVSCSRRTTFARLVPRFGGSAKGLTAGVLTNDVAQSCNGLARRPGCTRSATKMVVGWEISNRANAPLIIDALEMAHRNGNVKPDAIFHSDRGDTQAARSGSAPAASVSANQWDERASAGTYGRSVPVSG